MQRPVAQLKLVQSMLKIFVPPRANSVFGESELHTQHMWRRLYFWATKRQSLIHTLNLVLIWMSSTKLKLVKNRI